MNLVKDFFLIRFLFCEWLIIVSMKKKENIYEEWLVFVRLISKLFNAYYVIVGEKFVGKNVVDDVWWG